MTKTVIFDLGGVIVPLDFPRGYAAMSKLCGLPPSEIPNHIRKTGIVPKFETGQMSPEDFVAELSRALNLRITHEDFRTLWGSIFPAHTLLPEELFASLRKNYRLVLLSNTNSLHFEMVRENYPLLRHFDSFVLSYQVGAMKPSPQIYEVAIAEAACEAEHCFFTDDLMPYVEGARAAGMAAEQFESYVRLTEIFDARGIVWRG